MSAAAPEQGMQTPQGEAVYPDASAARPFVVARRPLTEDAQAELADIMRGPEAQDFFRDAGEAGYRAYIEMRLRHAAAPQLHWFEGETRLRHPYRIRTATEPPEQPAPSPQPVSPPQLSAPEPLFVPVSFMPPRRPLLANPDEPSAAPDAIPVPPPTVHVPDPLVVGRRHQELDEVADRYALLVAEQRLTTGPALLATEQGRGRVRNVAGRIGAILLDPFAAADYRSAEVLAARAEAERQAYLSRLNTYIDIAEVDPTNQTRLRLAEMDNFERRVQTAMVAWVQARRQTFRERLADMWLNGSEARRTAMVAVPVAIGGLAVGAIVGAHGNPVDSFFGAWYATTMGGGAWGSALSRIVSRYEVLRLDVQRMLGQRAFDQNQRFAQAYAHRLAEPHQNIDVTVAYAETTLRQSAENLVRLRRAKTIGVVAGAASFLGGDALGLIIHTANTPPPYVPPAEHTPTPTPTPNTAPTPVPTPTQPPINLDTYPWNVAHQLDPQHPLNLIRHTIPQYNAAHPDAHLRLVYHARTNRWVLQQGACPVKGTLLHDFNQFMVSHYRPTK